MTFYESIKIDLRKGTRNKTRYNMIGAKLYRKKTRLYLHLALYSVLALIGAGYAVWFVVRGQDAPAPAGFMVVFGAGMAVLTWLKSRRPLVELHEDSLEINRQNRPQVVKYRDISTATRTKDDRLVLSVRQGHELMNITILLRELEHQDAEELVQFCTKKGWKR